MDMFETNEEFYKFVQIFKKFIFANELVEPILNSLGCHNISFDGNSYSASNPDGDNPTAVRVWLDENLIIANYTRTISENLGSDIFSLVAFYNDFGVYKAVKYTLNLFKINVNQVCENVEIDLADFEYKNNAQQIVFEKHKVFPLKMLDYYLPYCNKLFLVDGISYETQKEFNIGYDPLTNRITIPIFSDKNDLIGVQGRLLKETVLANKYLYIQSCNKSQILYNLYKALPYIKEKCEVIVVEGAKAVMQLWEKGIRNVVATLGSKISKHQIKMICDLDVNVVLCFDEDVKYNKLVKTGTIIKEIGNVNVYIICDMYKDILKRKQSPSDDFEVFKMMYKKCKYLI